MSAPFSGTVTMSSAGVSPSLALDPIPRVTNIMLQVPSSAACDITIQGTLDFPAPGVASQTIFWDNISTTHYSTSNGVDGAMLQLQCPIAGLRLASSTFGGGTATLKVLQEIFG